MTSIWQVQQPDPDAVQALAKLLKLPSSIAALFINRNLTTADQCRRFLDPSFEQLTPPSALKDIDKATHRITRALLNNETIQVFGDYDVDGVTSTTLIWSFLKQCGASVRAYIPHRMDEGYGIQPEQIKAVVLSNAATLIITVDCGVGSHAAISLAQEKGVDVIVTDHHEVPDPPPASLAVINPKQKGCTAHLSYLAGVGVAFYLLLNLRKHLRRIGFWTPQRPEPNLKEACDLVALGTMADMVPLINENRLLVRVGIGVLKRAPRPGLRALMRLAGVDSATVDGQAIAFRLAPRINAAGRMGHARSAFRLLAVGDESTALNIAGDLERLNKKRRATENKVVEEVRRQIADHPDLLDDPILVLQRPHWHEGVLGIAAARAVRRYHRPAILLSTRSGIAKGSARSIPGVDIHKLISLCKQHLLGFGGHALAAGLQLAPEHIDPFTDSLLTEARQQIKAKNTREITIDGHLDLHKITPSFLDLLGRMAPFGTANPEPLFVCDNVRVIGHAVIGKNHLRLTLHQKELPAGTFFQAIWFNPPTLKTPDHFNQMAFKAAWNHWNGSKTPQIQIVAIR